MLTTIAIAKKLTIGAHRYLTLRRGGDITDRVVDIDLATRRLTYQRVRSPFPVSSYKGTVEVFESFDSRPATP